MYISQEGKKKLFQAITKTFIIQCKLSLNPSFENLYQTSFHTSKSKKIFDLEMFEVSIPSRISLNLK